MDHNTARDDQDYLIQRSIALEARRFAERCQDQLTAPRGTTFAMRVLDDGCRVSFELMRHIPEGSTEGWALVAAVCEEGEALALARDVASVYNHPFARMQAEALGACALDVSTTLSEEDALETARGMLAHFWALDHVDRILLARSKSKRVPS